MKLYEEKYGTKASLLMREKIEKDKECFHLLKSFINRHTASCGFTVEEIKRFVDEAIEEFK